MNVNIASHSSIPNCKSFLFCSSHSVYGISALISSNNKIIQFIIPIDISTHIYSPLPFFSALRPECHLNRSIFYGFILQPSPTYFLDSFRTISFHTHAPSLAIAQCELPRVFSTNCHFPLHIRSPLVNERKGA